MKVKIVLLVFACFYMPFRSFSQTDKCGTVVKGDASDLRSLSSITIEPLPANENIKYFPIKHHIVRKSDGTGGLNVSDIDKVMQELNDKYEKAYVKFYTYNDIDFIDSDIYYDYHEADEYPLMRKYNNEKAINIYYFHTITYRSGSTPDGYSHFPDEEENFIAIKKQWVLESDIVIHEVGHFFGLYHTHETAFGKEKIDGSNSSYTGDMCRDTPADPRLSAAVVNDNCEYIGNLEYDGLKYKPNTHNHMSYSRLECKDEFTNDQLARIYHYSRTFYSIKMQLLDIKTDTYIQNQTFSSGTQTVKGQNIYAGSNVTNAKASGDVIIQSPANVTFEAKESILLQSGFEVKSGAEFTGKIVK
ncbi:Pregnancy-associated plasma protein-A [Bacteroidales bacterium Barb4]|nr:Pregnancy-associated plasma protein-A [Bacteroidales bacterium Barb4]